MEMCEIQELEHGQAGCLFFRDLANGFFLIFKYSSFNVKHDPAQYTAQPSILLSTHSML